ncbi:FkbM family methyltransferase, partial [Acinetobacter baumannii]
ASEVDINISGNSYSSSILPMLPAHLSAAPESLYIGKAKTKVITLDSVFDEYRVNKEKVFLKIDTQGFEAEVLSGLSRNLRNITAVQLEMSIV